MCGRFYDIHDLDDITSRFRIADHKITRIDELLPWRYAATAAPSG
jgi:hypothetical protein